MFGIPNDQAVVGDWNSDGRDSVGVYRAATGQFFPKDALNNTPANFTITLGIPGDLAIAGDWNGDGKDWPDICCPSQGVFYLSNRLCTNCAFFAEYQVGFGVVGDVPFVGDWDGDGRHGLGLFRSSNGTTYLRHNATVTGIADITLAFARPGDKPLGGRWTPPADPSVTTAVPEVVPTFDP